MPVASFSASKQTYRVADESAVPLALPKQIVLGGPSIRLCHIGNYQDTLVALALDDGSSVFKRVGAALPGKKLSHLRQFESIGGLGSSQVFSVGKVQPDMRNVASARQNQRRDLSRLASGDFVCSIRFGLSCRRRNLPQGERAHLGRSRLQIALGTTPPSASP